LSGDSRFETDEREKLVGIIGLHILHHHLFHVIDKKTFKVLWELHKKAKIHFSTVMQLFSSYYVINLKNVLRRWNGRKLILSAEKMDFY